MGDVTAISSLFISGLTSATLLPGSSETLLVSLLILDTAPMATLLIAVSLGNIAGSCVNYWLGKRVMDYGDRPWFPVKAPQQQRAMTLFRRYGRWTLLFSWLPIIGDPLTLVAGMCRLSFGTFLVLVSAGKCARYATLAWITLTAIQA